MGLDAAIFVSKRLQRVVFALICLAAAQLAAARLETRDAPPPVRLALVAAD